jgi:hypothetical protein
MQMALTGTGSCESVTVSSTLGGIGIEPPPIPLVATNQ